MNILVKNSGFGLIGLLIGVAIVLFFSVYFFNEFYTSSVGGTADTLNEGQSAIDTAIDARDTLSDIDY